MSDFESAIAGWGHLNSLAMLASFVMRNGQSYDVLPHQAVKARLVGQSSFESATAYVRRYGGLYVEGLALRPGVPYPLHHAWATEGGITAVDPTWRDAALCQYFGVAVEIDLVDEIVGVQGHFGLFDGPNGLNIDLMCEMDPEFRALVPR